MGPIKTGPGRPKELNFNYVGLEHIFVFIPPFLDPRAPSATRKLVQITILRLFVCHKQRGYKAETLWSSMPRILLASHIHEHQYSAVLSTKTPLALIGHLQVTLAAVIKYSFKKAGTTWPEITCPTLHVMPLRLRPYIAVFITEAVRTHSRESILYKTPWSLRRLVKASTRRYVFLPRGEWQNHCRGQ